MVRVKDKILSIKEDYKEEDDEDDDDLSDGDDVDDEVFVRDGRKSFARMEKNRRDKQPLMPMRRKSKLQKLNTSSPDVCNRQPCNIYNCLLPVYFAAATIICLAFLMLLYVFLVNKLPLLVSKFHTWSINANEVQSAHGGHVLAPCLNFNFEPIWSEKLAMLTSETQINLIDVNKDNISDILIGTKGVESSDMRIYENECVIEGEKNEKETICIGGVMAIDGKSGKNIWHRGLTKVVLALHCEFEINGDSITDCIVTGRQGLLAAINGADGSLLWKVSTLKTRATFELYNALVIRDVNRDGFLDLLVSHYSRREEGPLASEIQVRSGLDGTILYQMDVPSFEPILQAPQILTSADGGEYVSFVTGDLFHKGGLYVIPFTLLMSRDNTDNIRQLYHFEMGILAAPVMVDLNADGTQDIVFTATNTVYAVDGISFEEIWNATLDKYAIRSYEITALSSIAPAFFDDDPVPDLLVTFSVGSTYLDDLYSVILVLNGKSGEPLLQEPIIRSSVVDVVGGITLSFKGLGNDAFVYWSAACKDNPKSQNPFAFDPRFKYLQTSTDLCRLRFNTSLQLELRALNQHVEPPGVLLFSQESRKNKDDDFQRPLFDKLPSMGQNYESPTIRQLLFPTIYDSSANRWRTSHKKTPKNSGTSLRSELDSIEDRPNVYNDASQNKKLYRNVNSYGSILTSSEGEFGTMLPRVSASGVLTKSLSDENSLDLILLHYEIKSNPACIIVGMDEKCDRHAKTRPDDDYDSNLRYQTTANKYVRQYGENGNLFISRNRIGCKCDYVEKDKNEECSTPLPYNQQSYPAYGGMYGTFAFKKRKSFL